eukprot:1184851-Prorocentrum_minimum.AAC.4
MHSSGAHLSSEIFGGEIEFSSGHKWHLKGVLTDSSQLWHFSSASVINIWEKSPVAEGLNKGVMSVSSPTMQKGPGRAPKYMRLFRDVFAPHARLHPPREEYAAEEFAPLPLQARHPRQRSQPAHRHARVGKLHRLPPSQPVIRQSVSQSVSQSASQSVSQSVSQSASQSVSQRGQPAHRHAACHPPSQPASQPVSQSDSQPVSQSDI